MNYTELLLTRLRMFLWLAPNYTAALYTSGWFRQAGILASLLGRSLRIERKEVSAGTLVRAQLFTNGFGQYANRWRDLVVFIVLAQKVDNFPVIAGQLKTIECSHRLGNIRLPVGQGLQVTLLVSLEHSAIYINVGQSRVLAKLWRV